MNMVDLRSILELLVRHVVDVHGIQAIDPGRHDWYWSISTNQWFDFGAVPEAVVGSLADDLVELQKLLDDPSRASANDLDRLAAVLHFLSYRTTTHTESD